MNERTVTFTPARDVPPHRSALHRMGFAKFDGPGGFTEIRMTEPQARAIAQAFHVDFVDRTYAT